MTRRLRDPLFAVLARYSEVATAANLPGPGVRSVIFKEACPRLADAETRTIAKSFDGGRPAAGVGSGATDGDGSGTADSDEAADGTAL